MGHVGAARGVGPVVRVAGWRHCTCDREGTEPALFPAPCMCKMSTLPTSAGIKMTGLITLCCCNLLQERGWFPVPHYPNHLAPPLLALLTHPGTLTEGAPMTVVGYGEISSPPGSDPINRNRKYVATRFSGINNVTLRFGYQEDTGTGAPCEGEPPATWGGTHCAITIKPGVWWQQVTHMQGSCLAPNMLAASTLGVVDSHSRFQLQLPPAPASATSMSATPAVTPLASTP